MQRGWRVVKDSGRAGVLGDAAEGWGVGRFA